MLQMLSGNKNALLGLCLGFGAFAALALPSAYAQTAIETQQQANDRIRSLSANTFTPPHDYVIGRGDLVSVEVYEIPELTREVRVSQTGTIGIPLVPVRLYVAGLTELQVQRKIAEVLEANGLVSHPQVMVSVKEKKSKPITIVGAVARPMVYQADRPVTLIQVLAEAGGISTDAGDTVIITRGADPSENTNSNEPPEIANEDAATGAVSSPSNNPPPVTQQTPEIPDAKASVEAPAPSPAQQTAPQETSPTSTPPPITDSDRAPLANTITVNLSELLERGDTQDNIPLQGGDVVTVPHAGIVYALGAVQRPGGFVSSNDRAQLSTLKLLALAGGMTRVAKKDRAVIIRKDAMGKQQSIPVDLAKIVNQKSEDVRLQPSDILYIPDNITKVALIRAAEIGLGIGTAVAIYRVGTR